MGIWTDVIILQLLNRKVRWVRCSLGLPETETKRLTHPASGKNEIAGVQGIDNGLLEAVEILGSIGGVGRAGEWCSWNGHHLGTGIVALVAFCDGTGCVDRGRHWIGAAQEEQSQGLSSAQRFHNL